MHLMDVADSYRQRIGGIIGVGDFRQSQLKAYHLLYLLLAAGAIVGDPLLDLRGGVLKGRDAFFRGGEEGYSLRHPMAIADRTFLEMKGCSTATAPGRWRWMTF